MRKGAVLGGFIAIISANLVLYIGMAKSLTAEQAIVSSVFIAAALICLSNIEK